MTEKKEALHWSSKELDPYGPPPTEKTEKLKPCPFCGTQMFLPRYCLYEDVSKWYVKVYCQDCGGSGADEYADPDDKYFRRKHSRMKIDNNDYLAFCKAMYELPQWKIKRLPGAVEAARLWNQRSKSNDN